MECIVIGDKIWNIKTQNKSIIVYGNFGLVFVHC
jgi:hypothetical protein